MPGISPHPRCSRVPRCGCFGRLAVAGLSPRRSQPASGRVSRDRRTGRAADPKARRLRFPHDAGHHALTHLRLRGRHLPDARGGRLASQPPLREGGRSLRSHRGGVTSSLRSCGRVCRAAAPAVARTRGERATVPSAPPSSTSATIDTWSASEIKISESRPRE
eukprot:scaffold4656_cov117-Isochrysis_galbana.AAC.22